MILQPSFSFLVCLRCGCQSHPLFLSFAGCQSVLIRRKKPSLANELRRSVTTDNPPYTVLMPVAAQPVPIPIVVKFRFTSQSISVILAMLERATAMITTRSNKVIKSS